MNFIKNILLISGLLLTVNLSFGQDSTEERIEHFNLKKTVAIQAYDPVSYFSNTPTKGNPSLIHRHRGVIYLFASDKNKKTFIANPSKYEPAYGGWCASAMASDNPHKVGINPKTYKIINNKLYLFYNKLGINTLNSWNKGDEVEKIKSGNKNWKAIISK